MIFFVLQSKIQQGTTETSAAIYKVIKPNSCFCWRYKNDIVVLKIRLFAGIWTLGCSKSMDHFEPISCPTWDEFSYQTAGTLGFLKSMLVRWFTRFSPVDLAFLRMPPDFLILALALARSWDEEATILPPDRWLWSFSRRSKLRETPTTDEKCGFR